MQDQWGAKLAQVSSGEVQPSFDPQQEAATPLYKAFKVCCLYAEDGMDAGPMGEASPGVRRASTAGLKLSNHHSMHLTQSMQSVMFTCREWHGCKTNGRS